MPSALVLLVCQSGCERLVLDTMRKMPGVTESNMVFGGYDIIAKVTADKMDRLKEIVAWKIRKLEGVKTSLTLIRHERR